MAITFPRSSEIIALIPKPARRMAVFILGHKILLLTLVLFLPAALPELPAHNRPIGARFNTWDGGYYLTIAAHGYAAKGTRLFYPLWPACIRLGSWLTGGDMLVSGCLLSNLLSLIALLLFHRMVWQQHGLPVADGATVLLLLFPGSVFFFFPYTESLFLLLLMICLICLRQKMYWAAALAGFLLPLTRATGIFILPVLLWETFAAHPPHDSLKRYWICLGPLLGYLCYFGIMFLFTGDAFAGFNAQQSTPSHPSIAQISDLSGFVHAFLDVRSFHEMLYSFLDRAVFVFVLVSLYWTWRLDPGYYVYAAFSGVIPALSNDMASYTRYASVVFPVFIVWDVALRRKWMSVLISLLFFVLQMVFLLRHISNQWAG